MIQSPTIPSSGTNCGVSYNRSACQAFYYSMEGMQAALPASGCAGCINIHGGPSLSQENTRKDFNISRDTSRILLLSRQLPVSPLVVLVIPRGPRISAIIRLRLRRLNICANHSGELWEKMTSFWAKQWQKFGLTKYKSLTTDVFEDAEKDSSVRRYLVHGSESTSSLSSSSGRMLSTMTMMKKEMQIVTRRGLRETNSSWLSTSLFSVPPWLSFSPAFTVSHQSQTLLTEKCLPGVSNFFITMLPYSCVL